jgi:stage IV sporulation protein B
VGASIQSLEPGKRGRPGEKIGLLLEDVFLNGNIVKNTSTGIFGHMIDLPQYDKSDLLTVRVASQIHEGPVEIMTVLENERVDSFVGEITKINLKSPQGGKGLVIKITDPRLLEQAGGIIQGMSGSPIIQDGCLVGAVTHVYVNDPSKGYGIPVEWMLNEAGIIPIIKVGRYAS